MKPASFEYVRPTTLEEALAALDHPDAKVVAGGQSLVPMMNFRLVQPERLVDINGIAELRQIEEVDAGLRIGALVRHAEVQRSDVVASAFPLIPEAMHHVAHVAIRNRGTIGGSLVHADPAAEWPLLVTVLEGTVEVMGREGRRAVAPDEFFVAPLVTSVEDGELVTAVFLPKLRGGAGTAFTEFSRRAGDFAIVAAAAVVAIEKGTISHCRLALGGVGDVPVRVPPAEAALVGRQPVPDVLEEAAQLCIQGLEPNTDLQASAEFRLHIVPELMRRVLSAAVERAKEAVW